MIKDYRGYPYENSRVENPINLAFGGQVDAGNRLRVSQLTTLGDYKIFKDLNPLFWTTAGSGGSASFNSAVPGYDMTVTGNSQWRVLRTKMFHPYFNGKPQVGEITMNGMPVSDNIEIRAGYFSTSTSSPYTANKDGFCLCSRDETYWFEIWNDGTLIWEQERADWDDPLDGTGPSGVTVDLTKFTVFYFNFLWLGGTSLSLGFISQGGIQIATRYDHAGIESNTFINTPHQPITYEIRSDSSGDIESTTYTAICASVASEGGVDKVGVVRELDLGLDSGGDLAHVNCQAAGTEYAILGMKLRSSHRDIAVELIKQSIFIINNDDGRWRIVLNPSVDGDFSWIELSDSSIEYAIPETLGPDGGNSNVTIEVDSGYGLDVGYVESTRASESPIDNAIRLGSSLSGTMDEIWLTWTPRTNDSDFQGGLVFREFLG